jgi:signal transduction histidine kinase
VLERMRDEEAQAAVTAERGRIARELHDVVAHAVSVMVVQAGAADQLLDSDPARQALHAIQNSGRQAIDELRRLLGILRTEGPDIRLEPQPGLGSLEALVDEATAATPVRVDYVGRERSLPPGVDLCAYRVVQEALTNARKHAPGTATSLTVSFLPDAVELDIINELPNGRLDGAGEGMGLIGMRERVSLYGGTCRAGVDAGRYRVSVRLPAPVTGG